MTDSLLGRVVSDKEIDFIGSVRVYPGRLVFPMTPPLASCGHGQRLFIATSFLPLPFSLSHTPTPRKHAH